MGRRRRVFVGIAVAIVLIGWWPGPRFVKRYRIWYHEKAFQEARSEFIEHVVPTPTLVDRFLKLLRIAQPPAWERYEYHKECLVELGVFEFHEFRLMNFEVGTGAHDAGQHFLRAAFFDASSPPCADANAMEPPWPQQLVLQVWCKPGGMEAWHRFVAKYDVPNYWEIRDQSIKLPEATKE